MCSCCKKPNVMKNKYLANLISIIAIYLGISFYFPLNDVYVFEKIKYFLRAVTTQYDQMLFVIFSSLAQSIGLVIGGILDYVIKFYFTTLSGSLVILISNIIIYFTHRLMIFYFFGALWGLGVGISLSLLIKNLILFSPNKKGISLGIIIIIHNLFYIVLLILYYRVFGDFSSALEYGFFVVIIGSILFFLFSWEFKAETEERVNDREMSDHINGLNKNYNNNVMEKEDMNGLNKIEEELDREDIKNYIMKIILSLRFWRLVIITILLYFSFTFISTILLSMTNPTLLSKNGLTVFAIIQIIVLLLSPLFGFISDKKGHLLMLIIISGINILPLFLLIFLLKNKVIVYIAYTINQFCLNGLNISFLSYIMEIYGIQESAIIGGIFNIFSKLGEIIRITVVYNISIKYKNGEEEEFLNDLKILFILAPICCVISLVIFIFERKAKLREDSKAELANIISDQ